MKKESLRIIWKKRKKEKRLLLLYENKNKVEQAS